MSDTQDNMVVAGGRPRWWAVSLTAAAFAVIGAVIVAGMLPARLVSSKTSEGPCGARGAEATPYARVPGSAQPVAERVRFDDPSGDAVRHPVETSFYFVTIAEPSQTALSRMLAPDEPLVVWMTECEKYGDETPSERRERSLQMMATSEDVAKYVALASLGYDARLVPRGVVVSDLICLLPADGECAEYTPASSVLEPGDIVLEAEGQEVVSTVDLTEVLEGKEPGDEIELSLSRADTTVTDTVEVIAHPDEPERVIIGFVPFERQDVELPFDLAIDTGTIGGPSAGLAFTLTLIDELTPGELTGGNVVAVTGTIDVEGRVGIIGGLVQKIEAARHAGVDVFLVPAGQPSEELDAAREVGGRSVEIVPVATLADAVSALIERGGSPIDLEPLGGSQG